jgi:hypothetical protein
MALELQRIDPYNGDSITGVTYYGYAAAGTQDTDSNWSIKRKSVVDGVLKYEYPYISGTTLANTYPAISVSDVSYMRLSGLVWQSRASYTYR